MDHNVTYIHRQSGGLILLVTFAAGVLAAIAAIAVARRTGPGLPAFIPLLIVGIVIVIGFLFSSLTIEIGAGKVTWWFGPGVARQSVALQDIANTEQVRNPWYYGWGIHRTPNGWLYNVSGPDAVQITLTSGQRFRLGTDEPEVLIRAITAAPR